MRRAHISAALRLAASVLFTLFGLLLATFLIARVVPIDPVLAVVGDRASAETYQHVRLELGLDQPLYVQFGRYLVLVLHGDFGRSVLTRNPVIDDIARFLPATIELATTATLLGVVLGIPAGVLAAARQGRWPDHLIRLVGLVGYSVPVFWLGLMALLLFYAELGWAAGPGRLDIFYEDSVAPVTGLILIDSAIAGDWAVWRSALAHLVLPAGVLGYFSLAYISRMTRGFMLEQLGQEYIVTARAKGLSERRVLWRHAFRNILVSLVTVVALSYASLLEGSVLTET
ncbi:MAG TPA: ABC transporter permease, partial [Stellaceae bacterium]|nr:ABC transporter permease [Stellaceae bacterium]